MSESFIDFIKESAAYEIRDLTRDGGRTVFVQSENPDDRLRDIREVAEDSEYLWYGFVEKKRTNELVMVFSKDSPEEFELLDNYQELSE